MDASTIFGSGGFPTDFGGIVKYVLICAVALLFALLAIYLIAVVLGLIFRLLFRQLRFIVVFVLSLAAFAIFAALVFFKPLTANHGDTANDSLLQQVAEKYKGLYPSGVPLVAWRITDITDVVPQFDSDVVPTKSEGERIYKVSYLPFGELIVHVDPSKGALEINSGADGKTVTANIKDLTDNLIESVKRGAVKTFEAIQNGLIGGAKFVQTKTNGWITGNDRIFKFPQAQ